MKRLRILGFAIAAFSIIEQDGVIIHSAKFAIAGDYLRT